MKIIRSLFPVIVSLCATTLLHAQELKPEIAKPVEIKTPEARQTNTPSPLPELKPQPQAVATSTEAPAKATGAPSPSTDKDNALQGEKVKPEAKTIDAKDITVPGGEEGRKIMSGNSTRPKDQVMTPATNNPKLAPPVIKPANLKNGQQQ